MLAFDWPDSVPGRPIVRSALVVAITNVTNGRIGVTGAPGGWLGARSALLYFSR